MVPELMRAVLFLLLLGACGRVGFDARSVVPDGPDVDAAPGSYTAIVLADNPRFLFRLDEPDGPVARDTTGQHHSAYGVFGGALVFGESGALSRDSNPGVRFEGDGNSGPNGGASVEGLPKEPFQADFTVELFFRPTAPIPAGYNGALFVCEDWMNSGFRTGVRADMTLELWSDEGGGTSSVRGTPPLAIGTWAHLVFVRRGTSGEIWKDGVLVASGVLDMLAPSSGSMTECGFGAFHGLPAYGVFDEVSAYDKALSPAQIGAHFAAR